MSTASSTLSSSLIEDDFVARLLSQYLPPTAIFSYLGASKTLMSISAVELDLSTRLLTGPTALEWCDRSPRFFVVAFNLLQCQQHELEQICRRSVGLRRLSVKHTHSKLTSTLPLPTAQALSTLRLLLHREGALLLRDISPLSQCRALSSLVLHWVGGAAAGTDAPAIGGLGSLSVCANLRGVELKRLGAGVAEGLRKLAEASSAAAWSIETLSLQSCNLTGDDLQPLAGLHVLRDLDLALNKQLMSADAIGKCSQLRSLSLTGCVMLDTVAALAACVALDTLYLTGCKALCDVEPLMRCGALRVLHLNKCSQLRDTSELGNCPSLELLNLRCSGAVVVPIRKGLRVSWDADARTVGVM